MVDISSIIEGNVKFRDGKKVSVCIHTHIFFCMCVFFFFSFSYLISPREWECCTLYHTYSILFHPVFVVSLVCSIRFLSCARLTHFDRYVFFFHICPPLSSPPLTFLSLNRNMNKIFSVITFILASFFVVAYSFVLLLLDGVFAYHFSPIFFPS